jgi:hypothetical protein
MGGVLAGAVFVIASPSAGVASAHETKPTPPGNAVSRDGFDNPAPGVRLAQAVGDLVFNQSSDVNKALDDSDFGKAYHGLFGTPKFNDPGHAKSGTWKGVLNSGGPLQDWYDGAQAQGWNLPAEKDLPGTLTSMVSGSPVTNRGGHGAARSSQSNNPGPAAAENSASDQNAASDQNSASNQNSASDQNSTPTLKPASTRCTRSTGATVISAQGSC